MLVINYYVIDLKYIVIKLLFFFYNMISSTELWAPALNPHWSYFTCFCHAAKQNKMNREYLRCSP